MFLHQIAHFSCVQKSFTSVRPGDRVARAIELENFELREQLSALQQVGWVDQKGRHSPNMPQCDL